MGSWVCVREGVGGLRGRERGREREVVCLFVYLCVFSLLGLQSVLSSSCAIEDAHFDGFHYITTLDSYILIAMSK